MKTFYLIAVSFCFTSIIVSQEPYISSKLEKAFEISKDLDVPESAHYNIHDQCIYVSSIVGQHNIKDKKGYISKISSNGKMIKKDWLTGLNAPKGVYCSETKLYVTDIDRLIEADIKTGTLIKEYKNPKSRSLNDVTVAPDGKVYISDSDGTCIFILENGALKVFLESADIKGMNGIYADENSLYIGAEGKFLSIDIKSKKIKTLAGNVGYLDGIEKIAEGTYITSDWAGHVQLINKDGSTEKLLDTTPKKINAADLGYIASENLVLIPTFLDNTVVAYRLKK